MSYTFKNIDKTNYTKEELIEHGTNHKEYIESMFGKGSSSIQDGIDRVIQEAIQIATEPKFSQEDARKIRRKGR